MCTLYHVFLLIILLGAATPHASAAQSPGTVDGRFITVLSGDGTTFTVTVQLRADPGNQGLGTSTIQFTYNNSALTYTSGSYDNYAGAQVGETPSGHTAIYNSSSISQPNANEISLNIVLDNCQQSDFSACEEGEALPSAYKDVATLVFQVDDPTQLTDLQWDTRAIYNGPGQQYTNGSFISNDDVLPVELVWFEAQRDGEVVVLSWQTASETNNAGFEIHSKVASAHLKNGEADWQVLDFVEGQGTTLEGQHYQYRVADLEPGRYRFRLRQVDYDGQFAYSPEVEVSVGVPSAFLLSPAYPNPFNPQTQFSLAVAVAQEVTVAVYNVLGRRVATLFEGRMEAGRSRAFVWRASNQPSGLYLIRVQGERFVETQRVTLVK